MRSSVVLALSAAVGLAAAQTGGNLPNCAFPCITTLPANCNGDFTCICTDKSFLTNVSCCIHNSCSESDQTAALEYAKSICGAAASTLPTSASCAPGASGSPTGSSSGSGSSSMSMTGSASSAASSASGAASSAAGSASSAAGSALSSASSAASAAASSATATGNIGIKYAADSVGIIGALVGAVALL